MEIAADIQDRLSLDIRSLEDGESVTFTKKFDTPLRFDRYNKGKANVIGSRLMYKTELNGDDVAIFVNDNVKSGISNVMLQADLDAHPRDTTFTVTKEVKPVDGGPNADKGYFMHLYHTAVVQGEAPPAATSAVSLEPDTPTPTSDLNIGDVVKAGLKFLNLKPPAGQIDELTEIVTANVKNPLDEAEVTAYLKTLG